MIVLVNGANRSWLGEPTSSPPRMLWFPCPGSLNSSTVNALSVTVPTTSFPRGGLRVAAFIVDLKEPHLRLRSYSPAWQVVRYNFIGELKCL
jgi:hypothetical protein